MKPPEVTREPPEVTVTILHFDDEVGTVSNIPDALFHLYTLERSAWVREDECKGTRYVEEFVIRVPGQSLVRVKYVLTADPDACRQSISALNGATDIAIFDLMRENPQTNQRHSIGEKFYIQARRHGLAGERVFILSAYMNSISEALEHQVEDPGQLLRKPISPTDFACQLARLFPPHVRIDT